MPESHDGVEHAMHAAPSTENVPLLHGAHDVSLSAVQACGADPAVHVGVGLHAAQVAVGLLADVLGLHAQ
jgi:hypothetical protein